MLKGYGALYPDFLFFVPNIKTGELRKVKLMTLKDMLHRREKHESKNTLLNDLMVPIWIKLRGSFSSPSPIKESQEC
jgi:hypothetical protein